MAAGIAATLARRSWRPWWSAVALSAAVAIIARRQPRPVHLVPAQPWAQPASDRPQPYETEAWGSAHPAALRPSLRPPDAALGRLASYINNGPIPSELGQTLGLVGATGVAFLLVVVGVGIVGRKEATWWDHPAGRTLRHAELLLLVLLLTATISGFSFYLSAFGLRDIRAWNRCVVVIGFLGLLAVAVVAETWARRSTRRRGYEWTRTCVGVGAALGAPAGLV